MAPTARPELTPYRGNNRNVITRAEIQSSGATNAYDLVQSLRSEWLRERGVNRWAESDRGEAAGMRNPRVAVEPGEPTIIAYLNANRLGGVEELRDLPIDDLQRLEWVPPQTAAVRYGSGHAHGVIQLSTEPRPTGSIGGAAGPEDAEGAATDALIRSAALELFFERGYRRTSMAGVANHAGLSRDRVRMYYSSKAQLFDALIPSDLAGRLDARLRQWIQTDDPAMENRLVALLQERRLQIVLAVGKSDGSAYEDLAKRLSTELSRAALDRFRGQDVERPGRAVRRAVERASQNYIETLAELLEATPGVDELDGAVRTHNRYHLAGVAAVLER